MDDKDWLEARLSAYVSDDGFTAQVVSRLPGKQATAATVRQRILVVTALLALGLIALQIVPLAHEVSAFLGKHSPAQLVAMLADAALRPTVILAISGGAIVLSCASIPILRRWA